MSFSLGAAQHPPPRAPIPGATKSVCPNLSQTWLASEAGLVEGTMPVETSWAAGQDTGAWPRKPERYSDARRWVRTSCCVCVIESPPRSVPCGTSTSSAWPPLSWTTSEKPRWLSSMDSALVSGLHIPSSSRKSSMPCPNAPRPLALQLPGRSPITPSMSAAGIMWRLNTSSTRLISSSRPPA